MKSICPLLILVYCASSLQAQEATREDFQAFSKLIEGRWIGTTVRVADSVFGKKGDKATNYFNSIMGADGNVLMGTFQSGEGAGKWIVTYDPGEKMIVGIQITSAGDFERFKILKEQGKWTQYGQGHRADGTPTEKKESLTVTDDGDTHAWAGSSSIDGKPNNDHSVVWRRVYKPKG